MIESFVRRFGLPLDDPESYYPLDQINEKLNYFRTISRTGFGNLTPDQIKEAVSNFQKFLIANVAIGVTYPDLGPIFRVTVNRRITNDNDVPLTKVSHLIGPPLGLGSMGRCNIGPPDLSVFYGSREFAAAILEIRPIVGDNITVSCWKIKNDSSLSGSVIYHPDIIQNQDLRDAFELQKQLFHPVIWEVFDAILKFSCEEFCKEVDSDLPMNYFFSAWLSHIAHTAPTPEGVPSLETIFYPSMKAPNVLNIALNNNQVFNKLDLQYIFTTRIEDIDSNYLRINSIVFTPLQVFNVFDLEKDVIVYENTGQRIILTNNNVPVPGGQF